MSDSKAAPRKKYSPPKIVYTASVEARATTCQAADSASCPGGPINS